MNFKKIGSSTPNKYVFLIGLLLLSFMCPDLFAYPRNKKHTRKKEKKTVEVIQESSIEKKGNESRDADDDDKPEITETSLNEKPYFKVITKKGTILRDKPKLKSRRLNTIPEDTIGEILEETKEREMIENRIGNWLRVEYNGKLGWIFSGFTIVKDDREDFYPLKLMGYFLIKSKTPIFYRRPGREILGVIPNYPTRGEIVPVYKKRMFYDNEYYYFELKSSKPNSEELVISWIGEKSGNFLSEEAFSAYTLRSRRRKLKSFEKEMIESLSKIQPVDNTSLNYAKIQTQTILFKEKSKRKRAYIVGYPTGTITKKGFGNFQITYYLVWKEGDEYHSLLAGNKKFMKKIDIDKDGVPEILAQFDNKDQPPLCHIYRFKDGKFGQIFPNYFYCDSISFLRGGKIEIKKEKEKILYKYSHGNLEKIEP